MSLLLVTSGRRVVFLFVIFNIILFAFFCWKDNYVEGPRSVKFDKSICRFWIFPPSPLSVDLKSCMLISKKVERQKQCWQEVILVAGWPKRARRQPHRWGWANWCKLSLEAPDEPQSNLWRTENLWLQILRQTLHRLVQPAAACHDSYRGEAIPVSTV